MFHYIIFLLNAFTNNKHVQEKCLNKQPGLSKLKITQKSSVYQVETKKSTHLQGTRERLLMTSHMRVGRVVEDSPPKGTLE